MTAGTLTVTTTTPAQSGPGRNGNEGVFYIPKASRLEPHQQMVSCCIWDTH